MRRFIAVMLLQMLGTTLEATRLYSVPEGWQVFINESSREFKGDGRSGSYRLVNALEEGRRRHQSVLSSNEDFGLAFLNFNGTNKYYLALMFGTRNSSTAAPVWLANRNIPVTENGMLTRQEERLKLVDANGSVVWSSEANVAYVGIEDTGDLKLLNGSRTPVWSSFDHPVIAILPNQKFVTGQRVVSYKSSSDPSEGSFVSEVQPSGAVAYMTGPSKKRQTYILWSFVGSRLGSPSANCTGYQTVMRFTAAAEVSITYEPTGLGGNEQPCGSPLSGKVFPGNSTTRYFQLAEDGGPVSYSRESENGTWQPESGRQFFRPPAPCGSYGLFENGQQCRCLSNQTSNFTTTAPGMKCSKPAWSSLENCSTRYETEFVTIAGASYFANNFDDPDRTGTPMEGCLQECRSNCSCAAFFYDQGSRNCYYLEDLLGSLTVDSSRSQQLVGFLKYQNFSRLVPIKTSSSKTRKFVAIGVSSGAAVAMATFALVFTILYRRNVILKELHSFLTSVEASPFRFSYSSLYSATGGFTKLLGSGGGGSVYEGNLYNGMKLAVKRLESQDAHKHFVREVSALGSISHINIVKLYGFCADGSNRMLVYEFMSNGSLDDWIFSTQDEKTLDWKTRYNIALDTARGLAYLHENAKESIIHLDIKPQNILLDDKFQAKVGDFGMAKLLMGRHNHRDSGVLTTVRGTPGYLAPEWLMHSLATKKCDVYSYGMVLLELIGGRKNLDCSKTDSAISWYLPAWAMSEIQRGNTMQVVDPSIRETADTNQARNLIHMAFWCTQEDPGARPSMDSVVRMLESHEQVDEPPLTFQFDVQAPGILSITSSGGVASFAYQEEKP